VRVQEKGEPIAERPDRPDGSQEIGAAGESEEPRERRPVLERLGLAAVAVVMAALFGVVAVAAFAGSEYFLAAMGFVGCMMTLAVGGISLFRD
jgi:hypothetical protein